MRSRLPLLSLASLVLAACPSAGSGNLSGNSSRAPLGQIPAFPGAEGFGAAASGGRGGRVIKVTNLKASGAGSLQAALNAGGPRIIVFDVSGVIDAPLITIPHGNVTIAGQTAPGGGITIRGRLYADYDNSVQNVIIRHLRIRPPAFPGGQGSQYDGMQFSTASILMFDHISVAFGVDETFDLYESDRVTVQWSTIEESALKGHSEGGHNFGLIQGPEGYEISLHHNLFAHHKSRTPAVANGPAEVINNVSYNVRHGFVHHNDASGPFRIIGNTYRAGPSAEVFPFYFDYDSPGNNLGYYLQDNFVDDDRGFTGVVENPWEKPLKHETFNYLEQEEDGSSGKFRRPADFSMRDMTQSPHTPVTVHPVQEGYAQVLDHAGAFPRDLITQRDVQECRDRAGTWGARIPDDLMAGLSASAAPTDADNDGMPDEWERTKGLSTSDGSDHKKVMTSGYTAIEEYINERADALLQ